MGLGCSCPLAGLCDEDNLLHSLLAKCGDCSPDERLPLIPDLTVESDPQSAHQAAVKLQKVYKSFRTRRKLADCAVIVEQNWWRILDFAELRHSSVSFFDVDKHESALSKWSRAGTRAAKVGKGLSKNSKARKLAIQHWLEAIDHRHRYGHNLHLYYLKWLNSKSREPFFYWLDIGEGKAVNIEKCPRSKLQQQLIKYLGPNERMAYEVLIVNGLLVFQQSWDLVHTTQNEKWIFVLSASKSLYIGKKKKGEFQHSSFLAGGVTIAAGRIVVENGVLKAVWAHSGHYRPTAENFNDFLSFLRENDVDLTNVLMSPTDDDDVSISVSISYDADRNHARSNSSDSVTEESEATEGEKSSGELAGMEEAIILEMINSKKKRTNSYQLGRQVSSKWTTGAGPRIGCVRDYPAELQSRALEEMNLSPRHDRCFRTVRLSALFTGSSADPVDPAR